MPTPISSHAFARLLLSKPDAPELIIGNHTRNIGEQPLSTELVFGHDGNTLYVDDDETVGRATLDSILDDVLGKDAAEFKKSIGMGEGSG
jgi:hypothetical protein